MEFKKLAIQYCYWPSIVDPQKVLPSRYPFSKKSLADDYCNPIKNLDQTITKIEASVTEELTVLTPLVLQLALRLIVILADSWSHVFGYRRDFPARQ